MPSPATRTSTPSASRTASSPTFPTSRHRHVVQKPPHFRPTAIGVAGVQHPVGFVAATNGSVPPPSGRPPSNPTGQPKRKARGAPRRIRGRDQRERPAALRAATFESYGTAEAQSSRRTPALPEKTDLPDRSVLCPTIRRIAANPFVSSHLAR